MRNTYKPTVVYLLLCVVIVLTICAMHMEKEHEGVELPQLPECECPAYTLEFCLRFCDGLGEGHYLYSYSNDSCVCTTNISKKMSINLKMNGVGAER